MLIADVNVLAPGRPDVPRFDVFRFDNQGGAEAQKAFLAETAGSCPLREWI
jgi:hypothetical protein